MSRPDLPNSHGSTALDTAFEQWLKSLAARGVSEPSPGEVDDFLSRQPSETRRRLRRMIDDELVLRAATSDRVGIEEGTVIADYRLIRQIGSGGMGTVWEAEQISLGSRVALKLLKPALTLSSTALQRFQREAQAGGRLQHVGVVKTIGVGAGDGLHWIAQELVAGGRTLAHELEQQRRLLEPPAEWYRQTAERFVVLAEALHEAHQAGVIHRDIKPGNILLGADGSPKMADFGLAQIQDDLGLSRSGEMLGTLFYMSPEQSNLRTAELDGRSDIFSLGATLYETLTFRRAFDGDTPQQVMQKIQSMEPMDPRQIHSRVPNDLAIICAKCLEKDPNRRYSSMQELADDLRRHMANEPISAQPPTTRHRLGKWCRRHPVVAMAGAMGTVALITISVLFAQLWDEQKQTESALENLGLVTDVQVDLLKNLQPQTIGNAIEKEVFRQANANQGKLNYPDIARLILEKFFFERSLTAVEDFEGKPEVQAHLLHTTATVMFRAGFVQKSIEPQRRAYELRRQALGEKHEDTAKSVVNLGVFVQALGEFEEAEELLIQGVAVRRELLGDENEDTLVAIGNLGALYEETGELGKAEPLLQEALELSERIHGPLSEVAMRSLNNLAMLLQNQGRLDEAEPLLEDALKRRLERFGTRSVEVAISQGNLGALAFRQGDLEKAEELMRQALEIRNRISGGQNSATALIKHNLSVVLSGQGKNQEALPLAEDAFRIREKELGAEHQGTKSAWMNLVTIRMALKGDDANRPSDGEEMK